jgi:hypothetical protein
MHRLWAPLVDRLEGLTVAREYARVKVAIWADSDFRKLSDRAQALYFRLLSSPTMSLCGVADWRPNRLAALTADMTPDLVRETAAELAERGYVVTDDGTEEVLIRSFVRHDGLIKTPNIAASMCKDYAGTASALLRGVIVHELRRLHDEDPDMKGWATASHLLSEESINPSEIPSSPMPSGNPSGMASPIPSGNGSHIPQPSSINQQPSSPRNLRDLDSDPDFIAFWEIYPRRDDKGHARKAWMGKVVRDKVPADEVIRGAKGYAAKVANSERKFIALPATWLNGERWADEDDATKPAERIPWDVFVIPECPPEIADDPAAYPQWVREQRAAWDAKRAGGDR